MPNTSNRMNGVVMCGCNFIGTRITRIRWITTDFLFYKSKSIRFKLFFGNAFICNFEFYIFWFLICENPLQSMSSVFLSFLAKNVFKPLPLDGVISFRHIKKGTKKAYTPYCDSKGFS